MNQAYHSIVDEVVGFLFVGKKESLEGLQLSQEGAEHLRMRLLGLSATPEDFRNGVRDLVSFANHLHDVKSPQAGEVILDVIADNPEVVRLAAEAARQEEMEQREKVGEKFAKFTTTASASEEKIETGEPSVSVLSLVKGRFGA